MDTLVSEVQKVEGGGDQFWDHNVTRCPRLWLAVNSLSRCSRNLLAQDI